MSKQEARQLSAIRPVRFYNDGVVVVDQRQLPGRFREVFLTKPDQVANAIRRMVVRGAPLIGITAAYGVALAAYNAQRAGLDHAQQVERSLAAASLLRSTRPTARDLFTALDRMEAALRSCPDSCYRTALAEAREIHQQDFAASAVMAMQAPRVLSGGGWALTICNTGALATGGGGTALAVIVEGYRRGLIAGMYACETRPLLQGARLTAWELAQAGVPCRLLPDSAAASLLARGEVSAVLTGADRIARDGWFANKVGTYMLALVARQHGVPFHVVSPVTTYDAAQARGADITIEQRSADEVRRLGRIQLAPQGCEVYNPAFDITPASLVTSYISELGIFTPAQLKEAPVWN